MGKMRPLVKHRMTVLVLIDKKSWYQWIMCVQRVLKTNLLHPDQGGLPMWGFPKGSRNILQHFMNCSARSRILIMLQVKTIGSMMGIIIVLLIRVRSYRYWMRLSRRSHGRATKTSYETIICSQDIWNRILILQHKWRSLSGMEDFPCQAFRRATQIFYSCSSYGLSKVEYWWCWKLSLYDPW